MLDAVCYTSLPPYKSVRSDVILCQAHEVLCLEILTLLLERPTDDSVEVAIAFLKECGLKLTEVSPRGINGKLQLLTHYWIWIDLC